MKKVFTMTEKFVRDNTNIKNIFTTDKQVTMINDKPALSKKKKKTTYEPIHRPDLFNGDTKSARSLGDK